MRLKEENTIKVFREDLNGTEPYPKRSNINDLFPKKTRQLRKIIMEMLDLKTAKPCSNQKDSE